MQDRPQDRPSAARPWLTARPIAHRGLHDLASGVIENSLCAAQAAIEGSFAIECDVQLSADEEALVFHDFTLERLTGESGRVDARKASELASIGLTGSRDTIPTLTGFLDIIGGRTPLVIEVKSRFDGDLRLARRTAEIIAQRRDQPIVLKSFDPVVVAALRELAPGFARGIVAMNAYSYPDYDHLSAGQKHALANLLHFEQSRPDFLSWKVVDLPSAAPFLCRKALGLPLMSWTVRTPQERAHAAEHADQMVFEGFRP
jgi:glycerophosphoryl diester phosphodiesterase